MTESRNAVLQTIRQSLGRRDGLRAEEYVAIERKYVQVGSLNQDQKAVLFEQRLRDYETGVYRCENSGLATTIAHALTKRQRHGLLVPQGVPQNWLPAGFEFVLDHGFSYREIAGSEGVLTGCALAIAETGTIVLRHSFQDGRRPLTLIPDYHLCVVQVAQIVETIPEGVRQMALFGTALITTISGPSATSDIEMTRIKGVHGPRTLDVILVL